VKPKPNDIRSIDGIVAGVMALSGAWAPPEPPSAYEPDDDGSAVFCVEDLMEAESGQLAVVSGQLPAQSAGTDVSAAEGPEVLGEDAGDEAPRPKSRGRKPGSRGRQPADDCADPPPPQSKLAAAAIETLSAGQKIECTATAYRRTIRHELERYAVQLSDAGRSEECSAVLAEIRRLDGNFGE
jgi:hypothetical protein